MPSFTGNKYPEELRALRAQYPNTQFDSHGRVTGGMPLDQYNAQTANPAAIPASVRTYSQFDPATNSWVRHTNGAAVVQSPAPAATPASAPAQGTPINFQQVLGYTPAGFEGATLNVGGSRANVQPRQVSRPLARGNARDISAAITPQPVVVNGEASLGVNGRGVTPSGVEFVGGQPVSLDTPPTLTPTPRDVSVNMSPDYRVPTPYASNETAGLAGYNPNIAKTQTQLALGNHYRQNIPTRPLTLAEHLSRLFGGSRTQEATNALRAATGLPPLE